jgi:branched-chain amino acid transport system substrate-binding protein
MRERVPLIFMAVSVAATLALGGAIAYEFAHPSHTTAAQPAAASTTLQPATGGGKGHSSSGTVASGSVAASGSPTAQKASASSSSGGRTHSKGTSSKSTHSKGSHSSGGKASSTSSPQQGVNKGVITVGGIYDETGPIDATVERDTVRSYFNLVNAQGGVNGYKLRLIDCDSKYDPSSAHQCAQKLISEGVLAIVGWLSLSGEQSEAKYLTSQGVPIIGGLGVPAEYASPLSFPTTPSLVTDGTALGTLAGKVGLKKPGVIFLNANFIAPVEASLLAAMKKAGITPVDVEQVDATKPDYTDIVLKFRAKGAQSVAAFVDPFSYARLFQAMERQVWHPPLLGGGLDKPSANAQYNAGCGSSCAVYGAYSATPVLEFADHTGTPAIRQYLGAVHAYYPRQYGSLDVYATYQWLAAEVFAQAIKNIGSAAPVSRQSLVKALDGLKSFNDGGITMPITYGPGNHDPLHCLQWLHNSSGRWQTTSGWNCF